jgi:hypothetical protein
MLRPSPATLLAAADHAITLGRLDRDPVLRRIRPGIYVPSAECDALMPWDRYLLRVHAVARAWRDPIFCLESSLALQGLPLFGEPRDVHVLDASSRRRRDVMMHAGIGDAEILTIEGVAMTSALDSAVAFARVAPPAHALAVADAVLRMQRDAGVQVGLLERAEKQANRRGLRRLEWVHARATPASESAGESLSRAVIEWLGYEEPELQVEFVSEGVRDRVDFFWRSAGVIGESDGYGKYEASGPDLMKAHFVREKKREDRLRRGVRGFARWAWLDVMRPERLDGILRAAGLRPVRRRQQHLLDSVALNPRGVQGEAPRFG